MLTAKRNCSTHNRTQQKFPILFSNTLFKVLPSDSVHAVTLHIQIRVATYLCLRASRCTPGAKSADAKGPRDLVARCQRTGSKRI